MARQDSSFYTNQEAPETVWQEQGNPYFVVRNGEMRINYGEDILRYTSDLIEAGIDTDQKVYELMDSGSFVNNSWYEVWSSEDSDYYSEPLHDLDTAIQYAKDERHAEQTNT